MYHDLNLAYADAEASLHRERICACLSLGYSAVASATSVAERLSSGSKCSTSDVEDASIAAGGVHLHRQLKLGGSFRPGRAGHTVLRQLTRLNFIASDPAQTQQLSTSQQVVRTYDLVAIVPRSERVLQQVGQRGQRQGGWCRCMSARTTQCAAAHSPGAWLGLHSCLCRASAAGPDVPSISCGRSRAGLFSRRAATHAALLNRPAALWTWTSSAWSCTSACLSSSSPTSSSRRWPEG